MQMLDIDDLPGKGKGKASDDKASKRAKEPVGYMTLESAMKVDLVADFRSAKSQEKSGDGVTEQRRATAERRRRGAAC